MRVFNFHGHPGGLTVEDMDELGIDRGVALAGLGQNEFVFETAEKSGGRLIPFVFPEVEDLDAFAARLPEYKDRGAPGIKFQPLTMRMEMDDRRLYPVYEKAAELGMVCLYHCGVVAFPDHRVRYASPVYVDSVAWDFPELKIVLAHLGGNFCHEALVMAEAHPNVHTDTAYLRFFCERMLPPVNVAAHIERAVKFMGHERVLYGYEGTRPEVIRYDLQATDEVKKAILWDNAARLLTLGERVAASGRT